MTIIKGSLPSEERCPMSMRERQVLETYLSYKEQFGYFPSFSEVAATIKVKSIQEIWYYRKNLEKKGYIKLKKGWKRYLLLVDNK